jgi:hypothetical protein
VTRNGREVRGCIASKVTWPVLVGGRSVARVHKRTRDLSSGLSEVEEGRCVLVWSEGQRGGGGLEVFDLGLWPGRGGG